MVMYFMTEYKTLMLFYCYLGGFLLLDDGEVRRSIFWKAKKYTELGTF